MTQTIEESDLRRRIEKIVRPHLKFLGADVPLRGDQSLGEAGLDSLASINLLVDLESEFGIAIPDELLDENTFSSLEQLEHLVCSLRAAE